MKIINIAGKEYKFEFTIEASLYNECTEKVTGLMFNLSGAEAEQDIREVLSSLADIPQTTLTMFYAGLLEHHGEDGDGSILSKKDAKRLIKQYFNEHKDEDKGNFYGVMLEMIDCMSDDGFFKQIGLDKMMEQSEEPSKKEPKKPQDHKKKATKATEK